MLCAVERLLSAGGAGPVTVSPMAERTSVFVYAADPILEAGSRLAARHLHQPAGRRSSRSGRGGGRSGRRGRGRRRCVAGRARPAAPGRAPRGRGRDAARRRAVCSLPWRRARVRCCGAARRPHARWRALSVRPRQATAACRAICSRGCSTRSGRLKRQVLDPRGIALSGLVRAGGRGVRLVAEGHETGEIARRLSYSERDDQERDPRRDLAARAARTARTRSRSPPRGADLSPALRGSVICADGHPAGRARGGASN